MERRDGALWEQEGEIHQFLGIAIAPLLIMLVSPLLSSAFDRFISPILASYEEEEQLRDFFGIFSWDLWMIVFAVIGVISTIFIIPLSLYATRVSPFIRIFRASKVVFQVASPRPVGYEGTPGKRMNYLCTDWWEDTEHGIFRFMIRKSFDDPYLDEMYKDDSFEAMWPLSRDQLMDDNAKDTFCSDRDINLLRGWHAHLIIEGLLIFEPYDRLLPFVRLRPVMTPMEKLKRKGKRVLAGLLGIGLSLILWPILYQIPFFWYAEWLIWLTIIIVSIVMVFLLGRKWMSRRFASYDAAHPYETDGPSRIPAVIWPSVVLPRNEWKMGVLVKKVGEDIDDLLIDESMYPPEVRERVGEIKKEKEGLLEKLDDPIGRLESIEKEIEKCDALLDSSDLETAEESMNVREELNKLKDGAMVILVKEVNPVEEEIRILDAKLGELSTADHILSESQQRDLDNARQEVADKLVDLHKMEANQRGLEEQRKVAKENNDGGAMDVLDHELAEGREKVEEIQLGIEVAEKKIAGITGRNPRSVLDSHAVVWVGIAEWHDLLDEHRRGKVTIVRVLRHKPSSPWHPVEGSVGIRTVIELRIDPGNFEAWLVRDMRQHARMMELQEQIEVLMEDRHLLRLRIAHEYTTRLEALAQEQETLIVKGFDAIMSRITPIIEKGQETSKMDEVVIILKELLEYAKSGNPVKSLVKRFLRGGKKEGKSKEEGQSKQLAPMPQTG